MSKVVDITEKLSLEDNPKIKIKDMELEVNSDAASVLKIMGIFNNAKSEADASMKAYDILFSKEDRDKIEKAKISFSDLGTIISTAVDLALGNDEEEEPGEE